MKYFRGRTFQHSTPCPSHQPPWCIRRFPYPSLFTFVAPPMGTLPQNYLIGFARSLRCRGRTRAASRAWCCTQRWTFSATDWRQSSVELSWQDVRRSMCRGEICLQSRVWDKVPDGSTLIFKTAEFPDNTVYDEPSVASMPKRTLSVQSFRRTDGHRMEWWRSRPQNPMASCVQTPADSISLVRAWLYDATASSIPVFLNSKDQLAHAKLDKCEKNW